MGDVFSKKKRSEIMAGIRSRGNRSTELEFAKLLRQNRISGWRRHLQVALPRSDPQSQSQSTKVRPDFVFKARRMVVFIDGCFWHGCPAHATKPESNSEFWHAKLNGNIKRDRFVTRELRKRNWAVLRIWEHELRQGNRTMTRLKRQLERAQNIKRNPRPADLELGRWGIGKFVVSAIQPRKHSDRTL